MRPKKTSQKRYRRPLGRARYAPKSTLNRAQAHLGQHLAAKKRPRPPKRRPRSAQEQPKSAQRAPLGGSRAGRGAPWSARGVFWKRPRRSQNASQHCWCRFAVQFLIQTAVATNFHRFLFAALQRECLRNISFNGVSCTSSMWPQTHTRAVKNHENPCV